MDREVFRQELEKQVFSVRLGVSKSSKAALLEKARSFQPAGVAPLEEDCLFFFSMEAANNSFISDRYIFLGESTLKNMVKDAQASLPFMNSHRTGYSAELPYGKIVDASLTKDGDKMSVSFSAYLLRGVAPNGTISTDDLAKLIESGICQDVSVGLWGGYYVCDVCSNEIFARDADGNYLCNHYRGYQMGMTPAQVSAQKKRGVKDGACSFTLMDSHCNECSTVYDGAVDGAQVKSVFHKERKPMDETQVESLLERLAKKLFPAKPEPVVAVEGDSAEVTALKAELAAEKLKANKAVILRYVSEGKLLPAQEEVALKLYANDPANFEALMNGVQLKSVAMSAPATVKPDTSPAGGLVEGKTLLKTHREGLYDLPSPEEFERKRVAATKGGGQ